MESLSESDKQELVNEVVEKIILMIPDIIGNLITSHMSLIKTNKKFYEDYPEFRDKKDIVASVVEMVEGNNVNLDYGEILKKAVPEIRKRLSDTKEMDLVKVSRPSTDISHGEI